MLACSNAECSRRFCEVSLSSSVVVLPHTHPRSLARVCLRMHLHLKIVFFFERMQGIFINFVSDKTLLFRIPSLVPAHYSTVSSRIFLKM